MLACPTIITRRSADMAASFDVEAAVQVLRRDLRGKQDERDALFAEAREHEATIARLLAARLPPSLASHWIPFCQPHTHMMPPRDGNADAPLPLQLPRTRPLARSNPTRR